jgi:hypothetical protein
LELIRACVLTGRPTQEPNKSGHYCAAQQKLEQVYQTAGGNMPDVREIRYGKKSKI